MTSLFPYSQGSSARGSGYGKSFGRGVAFKRKVICEGFQTLAAAECCTLFHKVGVLLTEMVALKQVSDRSSC